MGSRRDGSTNQHIDFSRHHQNHPMTYEDDGQGRTYAFIKMADEFKIYSSSDSDTETSKLNRNK